MKWQTNPSEPEGYLTPNVGAEAGDVARTGTLDAARPMVQRDPAAAFSARCRLVAVQTNAIKAVQDQAWARRAHRPAGRA